MAFTSYSVLVLPLDPTGAAFPDPALAMNASVPELFPVRQDPC